MPSAEITIHYHSLDAVAHSPWLLGHYRTLYAHDGYAIEDGHLWTPQGQAVLTMRQLRRIQDTDSRTALGRPRREAARGSSGDA
jgi:acyl-CoA thioesterase